MSDSEPAHAIPVPPAPRKPLWARLAPLGVLLAGLAAFFAFGGPQYLDPDRAQALLRDLDGWVENNLLQAVLAYMLFYAVAVSISVPGALWFTIGAGFLFGSYIGTGVAVIGASAGATIIFLAARYAFADWVRERFGGYVEKLQDGFSRDAFTYVLLLRLIPALPFFGINIATAVLNVPLRAYVLGTLIGVIPGAYVYAVVGSKLSEAASGEIPGFASLLTPDVLAAIAAFAALALAPWVMRRVKAKSESEAG
ncbi:MAG: TVP38/TMEM64 family protein [Pseudomonadota bacterium]